MAPTPNKSKATVVSGNASSLNPTGAVATGDSATGNVSYTVNGVTINNLNSGNNKIVVSGSIDFKDFSKTTLQSKGHTYAFTGLSQTLPAGSIVLGDLGITLSAGDPNQQQLSSGTTLSATSSSGYEKGWANFDNSFYIPIRFSSVKGGILKTIIYNNNLVTQYNGTTNCETVDTNTSFALGQSTDGTLKLRAADIQNTFIGVGDGICNEVFLTDE